MMVNMSEKMKSTDSGVPATGSTLPELMVRMRTGQLSNGPLKPYRWLDYTAKERTQQELNVQNFMEGCTFKSIMSLVVGMLYMYPVKFGKIYSNSSTMGP